MTRHAELREREDAMTMEGLPHAPMAMPEQQLERSVSWRGILLLPALVMQRVRVR